MAAAPLNCSKPRAIYDIQRLGPHARVFSSLTAPVAFHIMTLSRFFCGILRAVPNRSCPSVRLFSNQSGAIVSAAANTSPRPFSILFFGTDSFSLPTLARLACSPTLASHIAVVCPQDAPSGRGMMHQACVVKQFALQHGLPVHPSACLFCPSSSAAALTRSRCTIHFNEKACATPLFRIAPRAATADGMSAS